ncbi:hypothetical protein [Kitasatospora sp. P5_F3]
MKSGTSFTAPMTRAQKFQWYVEKGLAEGLRPLPASTTETAESTARRLVRALEDRFEILRTSLEVVDGRLLQRVHAAGAPLGAVEVGPGRTVQQCMAALVDEFRTREHGRVGRFLVRFHLLRDGELGWLAVVADNVAMDAGFHRVVDEAITEVLAGTPAPDSPAGLQPAETALREAGPDGLAERNRALARLQKHFAAAPARLHRGRPSSGGYEGRFYRSTLTLHGADRLLGRAMSSAGLLPSALVLAAFSELMCRRAGSDACTVNVSLDNRHNGELRRVLCATAQRSPVTLRRQDQGLLAAAADVQQALVAGHPDHGRYDPFDLIRERVEAQHRRGIGLSTDLAFNFVPPPQGWTELIESADREPAEHTGPASALGSQTTDEISYEYGASLSVRWSGPHTIRLSVHGDSDVLTPDQCAALLGGIELVLERVAAGQDCAMADIAEEAGLDRLHPGGSELRADDRWLDLRAMEQRLLGLSEVERAELILQTDDESGASWLTARATVAAGAATEPLDLREELLQAVETGELAAVPDWYEILLADSSDAADPPVVRSGDGRTVAGRPAVTDRELAVLAVLTESRLVREPDLDLSYVRAGGELDRYSEFADRLRQRGYLLPGFGRVCGMRTLRGLARDLSRLEVTNTPVSSGS